MDLSPKKIIEELIRSKFVSVHDLVKLASLSRMQVDYSEDLTNLSELTNLSPVQIWTICKLIKIGSRTSN